MPLTPNDDAAFLAFVERILGDPLDDAHKLVFADWLADRDDPRAPLLRVAYNVRRAVGPYEPVEGPWRARVRDSKDPLRIRTGPIPKDWVWPYPNGKSIPDITRPELESVRGAHGSARLLSIALITDLIESFRTYKDSKMLWWYSAMAAVELSACRLIDNRRRNHAIGVAYLGDSYTARPYELMRYRTDEKEILGGHTVDFKLRGIARACAPVSTGLTDYCLSGRYGSFVNAAHAYEQAVLPTECGRRHKTPRHQVHWHLRLRTTGMTDAWKAMTPWIDGKRVWDAEEELRQNSPPKADDHKRHQVHVGKYPCDHKRVDGKTAYVKLNGTALYRSHSRCAICDHERFSRPRPIA